MGINIQKKEGLVSQVRVMTLLPVILLSLLQGSFGETVKTVLSHFTLEMRNDCSTDYSLVTPAATVIDCVTQMIDNNLAALYYNMESKRCFLYSRENKGPFGCWQLVHSS